MADAIDRDLAEEARHLRAENHRLTLELAQKRIELSICATAAVIDNRTIESLKREIDQLRSNHTAN